MDLATTGGSKVMLSPSGKVGLDCSRKSEEILKEGKSRPKELLPLSSSKVLPSSSESSKFKSSFKIPENWANAPEFVPRGFVPLGGLADNRNSQQSLSASSNNEPSASVPPAKPKSYADAVGHDHVPTNSFNGCHPVQPVEEWCPYHLYGECRFGDQCVLLHGLKCEYCGEHCLHPYDPSQRNEHVKECVAQHEKDMELSFAVSRSIDKTCGICYEKVLSKEPASQQRFGILPSCSHCFCLGCIRQWRQAKSFENKIIRACPECRVTSDFVCPSRYWVESKEEKDKLIGCYKVALRQKNCRYYRNGEGQCPFGNKCFYRHALPNGQEVDVGPPKRIMGADGRVPNGNSGGSTLWDFVEDWELQWMDIEEVMEFLDMELDDIGLDTDDDDSFEIWLGPEFSD